MLRYLVRNWLRNTARERFREAINTAAGKDKDEPEGDQPTKDTGEVKDRPADVGIVFALGIESGGMEDLLEGIVTTQGHGFTVKQGGYKGRHVAMVRSQAGTKAAGRATQALIAGHKPRWIICAGFAGGLVAGLKRHDMIMAESVINTAGKRLRVDLRVDPESLAKTPGVHVGGILTSEKIARLPSQKRSLGERYPALAVDMESFAVAEACREEQVRFLAVRVITDPVEEQLPADVERLLRQNTRVSRMGAVVGAVWNRPGSVKDMWQLRENALLASDRLAKFLGATIEQLVPKDSHNIR